MKYKLAVFGVVITLAAAGYYLYLPVHHKEVYLNLISIVAVGAALTGFLYRVFHFHTTIEHKESDEAASKIKASSDLISEWNKPDMTALAMRTGDLRLEVYKKLPREISEILEKDNERKLALICILNFLEKMALLVRLNAVDENCCKQYFRPIVSDYHYAFSGYIEQIRVTSKQDEVFHEFSKLFERWKN